MSSRRTWEDAKVRRCAGIAKEIEELDELASATTDAAALSVLGDDRRALECQLECAQAETFEEARADYAYDMWKESRE